MPDTGLRGRTRATSSEWSTLIVGGARSGKSRRALDLARSLPGPVAVVATARPADAAMRARIARHRAERPPGWTTVEEPLDVVRACRDAAARHRVVVLECLTLWVANLLGRGDSDQAILDAAGQLAALARERPAALVIVSNEVGAGVHPPTEVGLRFQDLLGGVNQRVAAAADQVILMVAGIPLAVKTTQPGPAEASRERIPEAP